MIVNFLKSTKRGFSSRKSRGEILPSVYTHRENAQKPGASTVRLAAAKVRPGSFLICELLFAGGDEFAALGCGEGQHVSGAFGESGFDEGAGIAEEGFELGCGEGVPLLDGDPVGAGEIWSGEDAFDFQKLGEALGAGGEGEDGAGFVMEVGDGEHFASDGLVADPEDEAFAPLHGFFDVGQGEEPGAEEFGVHDEVKDSRSSEPASQRVGQRSRAEAWAGRRTSRWSNLKGVFREGRELRVPVGR